MELGRLLLGSGSAVSSVNPFGFSWPRAVSPQNPDKDRWIILDFLGFSRPNRAFSMVARIFRKKKILAPFSAPGALDGGQGSGAVRKRSVIQAASLT
jgi:hypothetical protein